MEYIIAANHQEANGPVTAEIETRQKAHSIAFMEQERIRIARDLHDELGGV